jgi:5'-3' exonuclease
MRLALLDGDVLIYASGFASDASAKRVGEEHEDLRFAIHGLKTQINSITERAEADDRVIYLSHPVNFREGFFPDYKTNRNVLHKPYWYDDLKEYLLEHAGAVYSELGDEADDALGQAQMLAIAEGRETIICTVDKDLDMIPGLHYNWSKTRRDNGVYTLEDPECLRMFYAQMIKGDDSDNIPGIHKKLGLRAEKKWFYPLEGMDTEEEMYEYVLNVYKGDKEFVDLNGKLLWIKRDQNWFQSPGEWT